MILQGEISGWHAVLKDFQVINIICVLCEVLYRKKI